MEGGEERNLNDLYAVLGLEKECSSTQLRDAYKKLVMRWHPDRCSASGNSKVIEEAKKKFQGIQEAYSVLSDQNKRFLYDVGIYDDDDDNSNNGMNDFLNEMTTMISQSKPSDNGGGESFQELQDLFNEIFQRDVDVFSTASSLGSSHSSSSSLSSFHPYAACGGAFKSSNNWDSSQMNYGSGSSSSSTSSNFNASFDSFCVGAEHEGDLRNDATGTRGRATNKRWSSNGRKQRVRSSHNISLK